MAKSKPRKDWFPKLRTSGGATAWGYLSRSGKTMDVYVRPVDDCGYPVTVRVPMVERGPQPKKKGGR